MRWALLLLLLVGCSSPQGQRDAVQQAVQAGQEDRAEQTLREALERWPADVPLLLAGVDLYLREGERFKPRLALHYAMRAARAAPTERAALDAVVRAERAAGGYASTPEGAELLRRGLEQVEQERAGPTPSEDLAPPEAVH